LVRWIDLGCPIDLDAERGQGWFLDDQRPTLALTLPHAGANAELSRILVGMYDYGSGLDVASLHVVADFAVDGLPAGQNLASKFKEKAPGVWECRLTTPITALSAGKLTVSVKDRQGNTTQLERTIAVGKK
jgi:hypothetical protein